jgi:hypothetical protein
MSNTSEIVLPSMPPLPLRTSAALILAAVNLDGQRVTVGELLEQLQDRTYGLILLALTLPNLIPIPPPGIPGVSLVTGILMMLLSIQLTLGLRRPWLPGILLRRGLPRAGFDRVLQYTLPYVERLERWLKPRWLWITQPLAERLLGVMAILLSLAIALPIPFGNWLPAVAMGLLALGLAERDGLLVAISAVLGCISLVLAAGILAAMVLAYFGLV